MTMTKKSILQIQVSDGGKRRELWTALARRRGLPLQRWAIEILDKALSKTALKKLDRLPTGHPRRAE